MTHQNSLTKYLILNSKCISTRIYLEKTVRKLLPPSPNSMLVRERSVALVNPDQTQKKNID